MSATPPAPCAHARPRHSSTIQGAVELRPIADHFLAPGPSCPLARPSLAGDLSAQKKISSRYHMPGARLVPRRAWHWPRDQGDASAIQGGGPPPGLARVPPAGEGPLVHWVPCSEHPDRAAIERAAQLWRRAAPPRDPGPARGGQHGRPAHGFRSEGGPKGQLCHLTLNPSSSMVFL